MRDNKKRKITKNTKSFLFLCEKYWGLFLSVLGLIVWGIIAVYERLTASVLRSVPKIALFWFYIILGLLILYWMGERLMKKEENANASTCGVAVIYGLIVMGAAIGGLIISIFMYVPERTIVKNGTQMVACVRSFLQEEVYYYEYKNLLFRGEKQIGYEDYGNGSNNPLEEDREPVREFP